MRIDEVISAVKGYCLGISPWTGEPIDEATTRDKVTYGNRDLHLADCRDNSCCNGLRSKPDYLA